MATASWATPATIASALTTELNALANAAYSAASAAIDNETGLYLYMDVELFLGSLTPTGTPSCSLFIVKSLDSGSNFEDGGGSTAPPNSSLLCVFDLSTAVAAKRRVISNLLIPPLQFKLVLLNSAGPALAATTNTIRYRRHSETIA